MEKSETSNQNISIGQAAEILMKLGFKKVNKKGSFTHILQKPKKESNSTSQSDINASISDTLSCPEKS